jgi:hypothetical protein
MSDVTETDLLRVVQYEHRGLKILVKIDRIHKTVSIVEHNPNDNTYKPKQWKFSDRGTEYMNGWIVIFEAMTEAIKAAKLELEMFDDEDTDKLVSMYVSLNDYNKKGK